MLQWSLLPHAASNINDLYVWRRSVTRRLQPSGLGWNFDESTYRIPEICLNHSATIIFIRLVFRLVFRTGTCFGPWSVCEMGTIRYKRSQTNQFYNKPIWGYRILIPEQSIVDNCRMEAWCQMAIFTILPEMLKQSPNICVWKNCGQHEAARWPLLSGVGRPIVPLKICFPRKFICSDGKRT